MNEDLKTSRAGLELIAKWEGCVLKPYKDIAGILTVGFGHVVRPGDHFPVGVSITREQALDILASDVQICETAIHRDFSVALNQNQFDALVSFGFNVGTGTYKTSGVGAAVNAGDFDRVPAEMLKWCKARVNGVMKEVEGLKNRRRHEGEVFSRPVDDAPETIPVIVRWTKDVATDVQGRLQSLGHYPPPKKIDGIPGPGTRAGLVAFANENGVPVGDVSLGVPADLMSLLVEKTGG